MTYGEKFKLDHPVLSDTDMARIIKLDCPQNWIVGVTRPEYCTGANEENCKACWGRDYTLNNGG